MISGKLKQIALHNLTLTLLFSLPFIIILEIYTQKFTVKINGPIDVVGYRYVFYNDLNNDGNSDKIYFDLNDLGNVYCKIYDPTHRGQFNVSGDFTNKNFKSFFADVDEDGFNEVIFLTKKDSSRVFLNIVNYITGKISDFAVCEVGTPGKRDFYGAIKAFVDLDRDGKKEILVVIDGGFALQPRALFAVNPFTGGVKRSPLSGSKLSRIFPEDLDNDSLPELIAGTFTYQNYDSTADFPLDDNWSRLIVLDHELNFKFQPLQFSNNRSGLWAMPFIDGNKKNILALVDIQDDLNKSDQLVLIGADGQILKVKDIGTETKTRTHDCQLMKVNDQILLNDGSGQIFRIMPGLELKMLKYSKKLTDNVTYEIDLNGDGLSEIIWANQLTGRITITDHRIKHPVEFSIPGNYPDWINPVVHQSQGNAWLVRNNTGHYLVTYSTNLFWKFRFALWFLCYGFFWGLLVLTNRIQSYKIREKQRIQEQMQELQYRVITSRFSPHFTFNVLNSLSSQLYNQEKPELYDYFNKFIRQLRYLYDDKNAVTRSLKEELQFCHDYLDIQKMRFPEKFDYRIKVETGVDTAIPIPKMMLHIFVENAFKHGLRPYTSGGLITIEVKSDAPGDALTHNQGITKKSQDNDRITVITIADNGIGREAASEYLRQNPHYSSGRGLEMLREFLELYNKDRKVKVEIEVEDLVNSIGTTGIQVTIKI
jgi:hypothetical protein